MRLEAARELAAQTGALATGSMIDIQLCGVFVARDDPEPAVVVARRAGDIARRLGLEPTLAVALGFEANAHARAPAGPMPPRHAWPRRPHMPGTTRVSRSSPRAPGRRRRCSPTIAEAVLEHVEEVAQDARFFSPLIGWWALLAARDAEVGDTAVASVRQVGIPDHYLARPYCIYAEAVVLGRAGDGAAAAAKVAEADPLLDGFEWYRQTAHRHVAEAALDDGWGDPVAWARQALAFYEGWGHDRLAAACRALLRRAGASVPRRGRGNAEVPTVLAALGVTSREADVLVLVAAGLSNREVADRLVLSVRTVESHVERLLAKTGSPGRGALADVAARAGLVQTA